MSRESIVRDLPEDFVRKMINWARVVPGSGYAQSSVYDGGKTSSGYAESIIPVLVGEAADVSEALKQLPTKEGAAVKNFWELQGLSMRKLAKKLDVHRNDVEALIRRGHAMLRLELNSLAIKTTHFHREAMFSAGL